MLGLPHPAASDPTGDRYTFEKPVPKVYGGYGYADIWMRDHFAWEYKESRNKKHKDRGAAYKQLNDHLEDLGKQPRVPHLPRPRCRGAYRLRQKPPF